MTPCSSLGDNMDSKIQFLFSIVLDTLMSRTGNAPPSSVDESSLLTSVLRLLACSHFDDLTTSQTRQTLLSTVSSLPQHLLTGGLWKLLLQLILAEKQDSNRLGCNRLGCNRLGCNRLGCNRLGCNRLGCNRLGY